MAFRDSHCLRKTLVKITIGKQVPECPSKTVRPEPWFEERSVQDVPGAVHQLTTVVPPRTDNSAHAGPLSQTPALLRWSEFPRDTAQLRSGGLLWCCPWPTARRSVCSLRTCCTWHPPRCRQLDHANRGVAALIAKLYHKGPVPLKTTQTIRTAKKKPLTEREGVHFLTRAP